MVLQPSKSIYLNFALFQANQYAKKNKWKRTASDPTEVCNCEIEENLISSFDQKLSLLFDRKLSLSV